jgi:hypothetical protein
MAISADGAMVPLRAGEWAEVRTVAIGEVPAASAVNADGFTSRLKLGRPEETNSKEQ